MKRLLITLCLICLVSPLIANADCDRARMEQLADESVHLTVYDHQQFIDNRLEVASIALRCASEDSGTDQVNHYIEAGNDYDAAATQERYLHHWTLAIKHASKAIAVLKEGLLLAVDGPQEQPLTIRNSIITAQSDLKRAKNHSDE